jgi:hypothetical protein
MKRITQLSVLGGTAALSSALTARFVATRRARHYNVRTTLGRRNVRPMSAEAPFRLTVVVPAYNEERIGDTVRRLRGELSAIDDDGGLEIVVVDDGSNDDTSERAAAAGADQVLRQPSNRGKGAAVRAGMLASRGNVVAFTDADLAYAPDQIVGLLAKVEEGWDVVVGNRDHEATTTVSQARLVREIGHRVINQFTRTVLVGEHHDTQCGLKAFRSDVARLIFSRARVNGFAFDVEVIHLVERYGLSMTEVPVQVENSSRSTVSVGRDAIRLVRDLSRIRRWALTGAYDAPIDLVAATRADDEDGLPVVHPLVPKMNASA